MTMTDPIADMLTRLRNANQAYHDSVTMPYSKLKQGLAEILKQEGYITSFEVTDLEGVVLPPGRQHAAADPPPLRRRPPLHSSRRNPGGKGLVATT